MNEKVKTIELVRPDVMPCGCYVQVWECEPPDAGVEFRVTREAWNDDFTVRRIYEIKLGGA